MKKKDVKRTNISGSNHIQNIPSFQYEKNIVHISRNFLKIHL